MCGESRSRRERLTMAGFFLQNMRANLHLCPPHVHQYSGLCRSNASNHLKLVLVTKEMTLLVPYKYPLQFSMPHSKMRIGHTRLSKCSYETTNSIPADMARFNSMTTISHAESCRQNNVYSALGSQLLFACLPTWGTRVASRAKTDPHGNYVVVRHA